MKTRERTALPVSKWLSRAVLIPVHGSANARKQPFQGSPVLTSNAQHERATNVRVRRDPRESKRVQCPVQASRPFCPAQS
eukprot:scaffold4687_cov117-Isochrysis_galbana.AAC.3